MLRRVVLFCVVTAVGAGGASSFAASILDITDSPQNYANAQVTVVGTAEGPSLDYLGQSAYQLRDGTRVITVFSDELAPVPGERIEVGGVVRFRPPDAEFTFPPVIFETSRSPLP